MPELRWIPDDRLEEANVEPWIELPLWLPERFAGTWRTGTERAEAAGLRCRSVQETVDDVAGWLKNGGEAELDDWRDEHRPPWMTAERDVRHSSDGGTYQAQPG
jgi:2'-hydroxyisoflavone reductase